MTDATDVNPSPESSTRPNSKVARLIEAYDLEGFGEELEALWTAEGDDRWSLRNLADRFNRRLLEARVSDQTTKPLDGETANLYRLLTAEDVSAAEVNRARRRLERAGVQVEALEDDFVTYQAIRTYLKKYRGAEYTDGDADPVRSVKKDLQKLRGRAETVTKSKLERLQGAGELDIGAPTVIVETAVICEECGTRYTMDKLLDRQQCECQ
jgi:hypothetical protein